MKISTIKSVISKETKKVEAAEKLNISRPTLYKWISRYKRFGEEGLYPQKRKKYPPAKNKTESWKEDLVVELAQKYWNHGVESLSDYLYEEHHITLHPTTIYRILKRKNERYTQYYPFTKKRHKKQLYAHKTPGTELQMDTKYPFGYKVGLVVYTVIDDSSRFAYAKIYETANQKNSQDFLQEVVKRFPFDIHKIRTDCGTEFVNHTMQNAFAKLKIEHRTNTPYCPEENGKIERFHRPLNEKSIAVAWNDRMDIPTLEKKLSLFLQWYNFRKKHSGLGMNRLTPFQKLMQSSLSQNVNLTLQCNRI